MWDSGFGSSWEAGFAEIGNGMRDIDMKRKYDVGFLQIRSGIARLPSWIFKFSDLFINELNTENAEKTTFIDWNLQNCKIH